MWIKLDNKGKLALSRQIDHQIRQEILRGQLPAATKLPSTRKLAAELSVSRNTVVEAYNQLIAEGYLKTYKGSGTVVAEGLNAKDLLIATAQNKQVKQKKLHKERIDFKTGVPALEHFPRKIWSKHYRDVCENIFPPELGYTVTSGVYELREAIAQYLYQTRGVVCDLDQLIVTSGATQGLSIAAHLLKNTRKKVLMENPTHRGLREVILAAGCSITDIPVDIQGICTELIQKEKESSFIYTTPSHQYPLGSILPIKRRLELVRYAEQNDCFLVEDDYDSEFRYEGRPISTLYELNPERVIYLGSFSKVLAPSIRLGFMILPKSLLDKGKYLKKYSDVHSDTLSQYTLARFIKSGEFERYIWKMKKLYAKKRQHMIQTLTTYFPNQFELLGHASGLHLIVKFTDAVFTPELLEKLEANGVRVYPIGSFYSQRNVAQNDKIILGYSHLSLEDISSGIKIIRKTLTE
ncbi:PLP-dependent aminotransferase family protein [Enterococcus malodoratus]|uniref:HTH gntR-type domain-containing protein n=1 Tax=Enterococcus malodoratus ATCC 43197 TaxID=1158601 RepID=R2P0N5_9ENTE|nr:PLP-dependent aminotransferase family protein [Enterococcus malodoratus]EOH76828.1 hypothetical protein UAI_02503 [Enterococcus malodoratus ATCC 43197]EOT63471.1 hypothetical protein I585_04301 [Enterococcus malodoratus ATCC 43197]OJG65036.1 hypothetical protein RV07_GL003490 [Enterococcus malodoratus]SPW69414.1 transcriptional regulator, GntR family [Enterococcus malodoratus]STD65792.1 transcriptional regulator, GntR family [Enterococcus malodoratus]